jgi:hypothetical protein
MQEGCDARVGKIRVRMNEARDGALAAKLGLEHDGSRAGCGELAAIGGIREERDGVAARAAQGAHARDALRGVTVQLATETVG